GRKVREHRSPLLAVAALERDVAAERVPDTAVPHRPSLRPDQLPVAVPGRPAPRLDPGPVVTERDPTRERQYPDDGGVVPERARRGRPAAGVPLYDLETGDHPQQVDVVDRHVEQVR